MQLGHGGIGRWSLLLYQLIGLTRSSFALVLLHSEVVEFLLVLMLTCCLAVEQLGLEHAQLLAVHPDIWVHLEVLEAIRAMRDRIDGFPLRLEGGLLRLLLLLSLLELLLVWWRLGFVLGVGADGDVSVCCLQVEGSEAVWALLQVAVEPRFRLVSSLVLLCKVSDHVSLLFGLLPSPDGV